MVQCIEDDDDLRLAYRYDLHDRVLTAARDGNKVEIETLLAEWKRGERYQNIINVGLGAAVENNQTSLIGPLMACGASLDTRVDTVLKQTVSIDVLEALVDSGWDVNSLTLGGRPVIL